MEKNGWIAGRESYGLGTTCIHHIGEIACPYVMVRVTDSDTKQRKLTRTRAAQVRHATHLQRRTDEIIIA